MKSASDWSQKILDDLRYYNTELPGIIRAIQDDALKAGYVRGVEWATNYPDCFEYRHKAAADFADKETNPNAS